MSDLRAPWWKLLLAALVLVAVALLAAPILTIGAAERALGADRPDQAAQLRPNAAALARLGAAAQRAGRPQDAARLAQEALAASPINVVAIRTLGQARAKLDAPTAGDELLLLASKWGWRDRPTQFWALEKALRAGQGDVVLQRGEAMIRLNSNRQGALLAFRLLANDPATRALLVQRLALRPDWRPFFFEPELPIGANQLDAMNAVLLDLARMGATPSRGEAAATFRAMLDGNKGITAFGTYRRLFARGGKSLLPGGDFSPASVGAGQTQTPFDWNLRQEGAAGAELARAPDGAESLFASASGSADAVLAGRTLLLPPGRYVLTGRMLAQSATAGDLLVWTMTCRGGRPVLSPDRPVRAQGETWTKFAVPFTVPVGCPIQQLELIARGGDDTQAPPEAFFDDLGIARG